MPNSDAKVVRGLSIAVLILCILAVAGSLLVMIFLGIGGVALSDPSVASSAAIEIDNGSGISADSLSGDEVVVLAMLSLGVLGMFMGWLIICSIVPLVAAILGMRNYNNVDKLGGAFGWAIAGAVFSFLCGNLITMVLLIVSAVYINKLRRAPMVPYGQAQPVYGYAQQPGNQQQPPTPPAQ